MRFFKALLKWVAILVVVLVAVAFLLPSSVSVSRSTVISADAAKIFPHINSMQATEAWSPWLARDPNVQLSYDGPEQGVGNTLRWASDQRDVGKGMQVITVSIPNERVETALDFGSQGLANAYFTLEPAGGETVMTWGFDTELGMNPMSRWFGLMLDSWVGGDYEVGLANLKALVEGG